MKAVILLLVVVCVGCGTTSWVSEGQTRHKDVIEAAIRGAAKKPIGELTKADLEKVTELSLAFSNITDTDLKDLAKFENLADLSLYWTSITDTGVKEVAKLKNLKELNLGQTSVTDISLKRLANLENLTYLGLERTQITDTGLMELANLKNLIELRLVFCRQITGVGVAELQKALPKCKIH